MSITGSIVVYVCLWWIVFFAILPIDVNREKKGNIEGIDPGAPENPKITKKIIYCTLITSGIFIVIYLLVINEILNLRNFCQTKYFLVYSTGYLSLKSFNLIKLSI